MSACGTGHKHRTLVIKLTGHVNRNFAAASFIMRIIFNNICITLNSIPKYTSTQVNEIAHIKHILLYLEKRTFQQINFVRAFQITLFIRIQLRCRGNCFNVCYYVIL